MNRNILNFGKIAFLSIALGITSCNKNNTDDPPVVPPTQNETFNFIYRVAGTSAIADWAVQPFSESEVQSTQTVITFDGKGYPLEQDRTNEVYTTNNGKTMYVFSSMSRNITKYESTGDASLYKKVGQLNITPVVGNVFANWKVLDEKNAIVYVVTAEHQKNEDDTYKKTVATLSIGRVDLESFTVDVQGAKRITLPELPANPALQNNYIQAVEHPILLNGKLYFGLAKRGYDPTKQGRAATISNENAYNTSTLVLNYPSLDNLALIETTKGTGMSAYASVLYGPSQVKTENNDIYQVNPMKGKVLKISNGTYDDSYEFDLQTALGSDSPLAVSGMYYTENNIAYVTYAPTASMLQGGLIYQEGKAVWNVARVDFKNKSVTKMNVAENLWLTFHQRAKFYNGKLYMALCPMTGDGNVYIFDPAKAASNGFEKGAVLKSAGGSIYLGIL